MPPPEQRKEKLRFPGTARLLAGVVLVLAMIPSELRAETLNDGGVWASIFARGGAGFISPKLEKLRWVVEARAEFRNDATTFDEGFVRPGLGYAILPSTSVWLGYGWFRGSPPVGTDVDEHRIWQQLNWTRKFEPFGFESRTRLEQRFVETGNDAGWRLRQRLLLTYPLPARFRLAIFNELFLNFNDTDWGAAGGFDQNRFFAGVGWYVDPSRHVRLDVGYLNQFLDRRVVDRLNHILVLNLSLGF